MNIADILAPKPPPTIDAARVTTHQLPDDGRETEENDMSNHSDVQKAVADFGGDEHCALLPVGTRIRFLKTLECGPNEYSPGNLYARKGDEGVITGHGTWEGYWVKWEHWPYAAFGASRDEFEPIDTVTTPAPT